MFCGHSLWMVLPNQSVAAHTEVTELPAEDLGAEATQPLVDTTKV